MTSTTVDVWRFDGPSIPSHEAIDNALAYWTGSHAVALLHSRDVQGRPIISSRPEVSVSLAHSGGMTLVAIGEGCRIGIDLEIAQERGIAALSRHALTSAEQEELKLRKTQWLETLLSYWTRKEALLKAVGVGLAVEPSLIELPPPGETHVLALPAELGRPENWSVREIEVDGHVAAVAADVTTLDVRLHEAR
jgi:4'-phosphopantetheinyl transferase